IKRCKDKKPRFLSFYLSIFLSSYLLIFLSSYLPQSLPKASDLPRSNPRDPEVPDAALTFAEATSCAASAGCFHDGPKAKHPERAIRDILPDACSGENREANSGKNRQIPTLPFLQRPE